MKKKYISLVLILSMFAVGTGCGDFLDEESRETVEAGDDRVYTSQELLTGVYGMFCSFSYAFSYLGITEIISDNADKGSSPDDTGSDKDVLDALTHTTSSGSFREMWSRWYSTIGRATQSVEYTLTSGLDTTLENRLTGEAQFLRALCYFYLVRCWGAVPIQEQDLTVRAPIEEVYAYIEADLLDAVRKLPRRSEYPDADLGRATKGAAQGLLAKVYLYQRRWQEAYNYADSVVISGEYRLLPNYIDVFKSDAQYHNSPESLFEFQAKASDAAIAHGIRQYSATQGARGDTGWGWGFNTPSENLYNAYTAAGDIQRRDATIITRNSTLYDGRVVGSTENERYNYKAYSSSAPGSDWNDRFVLYLRYAEILLIKAEAANELGQSTPALGALKLVRDRVNLPDITTTDQPRLRQAIWNERRLELAMEHDRWFDLLRTGQAGDAMAADGKTFVTGKHELFPIPNEQLLQIPALGQNQGW